jgi:phospholipid transport system substrate-binding protein
LVLFLLNGEKMRPSNISLSVFLLFFSTLSLAEQGYYKFYQETAQPEVPAKSIIIKETLLQEPVSPVQAIQTAIIKLNQLKKISNYAPQFVGKLINQEVAPLFDFNHIANEVLLANHLQLKANQRRYFTNKIKQNIISALLSKLTQGRSTAFAFVSARPMMDGSIAVKLKIEGYYSYGVLLDLIFHQTANKDWKIADVVLNNDSLVNYYQKMVSIKLRRYGVYGMLGRF